MAIGSSFSFKFAIVALTMIGLTNATFKWSGYTWEVHQGATTGPDQNELSAKNVFVDSDNYLHMKLTVDNGKPVNAEIASTDNDFTFGTYQWKIEGDIVNLDPATVLGLFTYGGPDGSNEIDVEAALWGETDPRANNLANTVYPARLGDKPKSVSKGTRVVAAARGNYTTHRFEWTRQKISFQSFYGFTDNPTSSDVIFSYTTPRSFRKVMPVKTAPVYINLWSFQRKPPANGKSVEFIIHQFNYTAAN